MWIQRIAASLYRTMCSYLYIRYQSIVSSYSGISSTTLQFFVNRIFAKQRVSLVPVLINSFLAHRKMRSSLQLAFELINSMRELDQNLGQSLYKLLY